MCVTPDNKKGRQLNNEFRDIFELVYRQHELITQINCNMATLQQRLNKLEARLLKQHDSMD